MCELNICRLVINCREYGDRVKLLTALNNVLASLLHIGGYSIHNRAQTTIEPVDFFVTQKVFYASLI